jgi:DNA-binding response OmpR family regulator
MTAVALSKPEILARLWEIHSVRLGLDREEAELWTRLQKPKRNKAIPIELTFGKDIIQWGNGGALSIKGKGYKFVKSLYDADGMRLKRERLGMLVWKNDCVRQNTFLVFLHWLSEKLDEGQFPYRLIPIKSKERIEIVKYKMGEKPVKKRIQSEIIGAKLDIR